MEDVMRLVIAAAMAVMLLGLAERMTLDERGLRIAAAPSMAATA